MTRRVDVSAWILTGLLFVALLVAFVKDPALPVRGLLATGRLSGVRREAAGVAS